MLNYQSLILTYESSSEQTGHDIAATLPPVWEMVLDAYAETPLRRKQCSEKETAGLNYVWCKSILFIVGPTGRLTSAYPKLHLTYSKIVQHFPKHCVQNSKINFQSHSLTRIVATRSPHVQQAGPLIPPFSIAPSTRQVAVPTCSIPTSLWGAHTYGLDHNVLGLFQTNARL